MDFFFIFMCVCNNFSLHLYFFFLIIIIKLWLKLNWMICIFFFLFHFLNYNYHSKWLKCRSTDEYNGRIIKKNEIIVFYCEKIDPYNIPAIFFLPWKNRKKRTNEINVKIVREKEKKNNVFESHIWKLMVFLYLKNS